MLQQAKRIFFIGLGGTGMRGLAYLLHKQGKEILGTDTNFEALAAQNPHQYRITPEDSTPDILADADLVIYSDAVATKHPARVYASTHQLPQQSYQAALGELSRMYTTIAVTGTHGKSSTTALLAHILHSSGIDASVALGAAMPAWNNEHAYVGTAPYLVLEADEYRDHFLSLQPAHAIITSIDFDHPDYFESLEATRESYQKFINLVSPQGSILTTPKVHASNQELSWPPRTKVIDTQDIPDIPKLPGTHMQQNAALAAAAAESIGIPRQTAIAALASFPGLGRRLETIGEWQGMHVISDYGHHPAEIAATIAAERQVHADAKIIVLVEPHTDARLQKFLGQFVDVLQSAPVNGVMICPTFYVKGREAKPVNSSEKLYAELKSVAAFPTHLLEDYSKLPEQLTKLSRNYTVLVAFTAGALDGILRDLVQKNHEN